MACGRRSSRSTIRSWPCHSIASWLPATLSRAAVHVLHGAGCALPGSIRAGPGHGGGQGAEPGAQVKLAGSAKDAILVERSLHEGFFREFEVTPAQFAATPPSPTCSAYCDFLLATAYRHPFAVTVAALLPCFQIYHEVGKRLHRAAQPDNPYQRWIDTYQDEEFGRSVREVLALTDAAHDDAAAASAADARGLSEGRALRVDVLGQRLPAGDVAGLSRAGPASGQMLACPAADEARATSSGSGPVALWREALPCRCSNRRPIAASATASRWRFTAVRGGIASRARGPS